MAENTDVSYRYAVEEDQGVGFSENTGADWLFPATNTDSITIYDNDGLAHTLVLDNSDGMVYDISGREGPTGGSVSKIWKDKVGTDGSGGTDVIPALTFAEDIGTYEHYFLGALSGHVYTRPYVEADGYPSGLQIDLYLYVNGELTTYSALAEDINLPGDISYDRDVDAHRVQLKLVANKGEHIIVGRQQYYKVRDQWEGPSRTETTVMEYQAALSNVVMWPDLVLGVLKDRVNGAAITATWTASSDPVSNTRGISFSAAITLPASPAMTDLLVWYKGTIASVTIGGNAVSLTDHSSTTVNGWTLAYVTGVSESGAVVITPTGTAQIFDLRIYNSTISTAQRTYYFNDVNGNTGYAVLPE